MITLRSGGEEILLEPEEWRRWVEDGRISPDAWVLVPGGTWTRAGLLPEYRSLAAGPARDRTRPLGSLRDAVFPRRGLSATEALILVNLLVAATLVVMLGAGYLPTISSWAGGWWSAVHRDHAYGWWLVTIFLHSGPRHLAGNMVALLIAAGSVEFLAGRSWTLATYFLTGVAGMAFSYWGHGNPPLSIGASGAVYGLAGAAISMVLRHRGHFTYRQRWKAWRVYVPLFLVLALPSLLQADYWGHTGGLVSGLLLGPWIPLRGQVRALAAEDSMDL